MEPIAWNFRSNVSFKVSVNGCCTTKPATPTREIRRRRAKEVSFSDLALHEERQLYTLDKYFQDEEAEPSYQQAGENHAEAAA